jgi:hypothetical protein
VAYLAACRDRHGGIYRDRDLAHRGGMSLRSSWAAKFKLRHYQISSIGAADNLAPNTWQLAKSFTFCTMVCIAKSNREIEILFWRLRPTS